MHLTCFTGGKMLLLLVVVVCVCPMSMYVWITSCCHHFLLLQDAAWCCLDWNMKTYMQQCSCQIKNPWLTETDFKDRAVVTTSLSSTVGCIIPLTPPPHTHYAILEINHQSAQSGCEGCFLFKTIFPREQSDEVYTKNHTALLLGKWHQANFVKLVCVWCSELPTFEDRKKFTPVLCVSLAKLAI